MTNLRLFVADDDAVARKALVAMLATKEGFDVVAEAEDEDAAIEKHAQCLPDITLLGVRHPSLKGFNTLHQLRYRHPDAKVIMLSCSRLPQDVVHARQLGACGCLPKGLGRLALCSAIERVSHGHQVWDVVEGTAAPVQILSSREVHVLEGARKGFCNGDIGRALNISEHTVKSHIKNVLRKLHAANRAEAVARGYELNLFK